MTTTFIVEQLPRPRIHSMRSCEHIAAPVEDRLLGPDLVEPIFCQCLLDPNHKEPEAWPITTTANPTLIPYIPSASDYWVSLNGNQTTMPMMRHGYVEIDQVPSEIRVLAMTASAPDSVVGFIVVLPAVDKFPATYWPMLLNSSVWPFFSTEAIAPTFIPTDHVEACTLGHTVIRRTGAVGAITLGKNQSLITMLSIVAWLEAWNPFVVNVAHLLGCDIPLLDLEKRREAVLNVSAMTRIAVPPGLPML